METHGPDAGLRGRGADPDRGAQPRARAAGRETGAARAHPCCGCAPRCCSRPPAPRPRWRSSTAPAAISTPGRAASVALVSVAALRPPRRAERVAGAPARPDRAARLGGDHAARRDRARVLGRAHRARPRAAIAGRSAGAERHGRPEPNLAERHAATDRNEGVGALVRLSLLSLLVLVAAVAWPGGAGAQAKVCAGHPKDPSVVCARDSAHIVDICDRDRRRPPRLRPGRHQVDLPGVPVALLRRQRQQGRLLEPPLPQPGRVDPDLRPDRGLRQGQGDRRRAAAEHHAAAPRSHPRADAGAHASPRRRPRHHPRAARCSSASASTAHRAASGCPSRCRCTSARATPSRASSASSSTTATTATGSGSSRARTGARPYRRTLPIRLAPGPHHVYARVYYKRAGSSKLRRKTVVRRFTVCA